jgi:hypothetical protein
MGTSSDCARIMTPSTTAPPPLAFSSRAEVGLYTFVFGGMIAPTSACPKGKFGRDKALGTTGSVWSLNMATYSWSQVKIPGSVAPDNRTSAAVVRIGAQSGLEQPVLYIGGADVKCVQVTDGQPCVLLTKPLNDIWMVDTAPSLQASAQTVCSVVVSA